MEPNRRDVLLQRRAMIEQQAWAENIPTAVAVNIIRNGFKLPIVVNNVDDFNPRYCSSCTIGIDRLGDVIIKRNDDVWITATGDELELFNFPVVFLWGYDGANHDEVSQPANTGIVRGQPSIRYRRLLARSRGGTA